MIVGDRVIMIDSFYPEDIGKTGTIKKLYTDSQGRKCADFYPDFPNSKEDDGLWGAFENQFKVIN